MRKLAWHTSFRRAFRRRTRNNAPLQDRVFQVLVRLAQDPFHAALKTHKLSGQLEGLWACWVEYDCRIVFAFEAEPGTGEEMIVLVDLGTHDEVY
jgi:addiction module RelE/StbE family toxin